MSIQPNTTTNTKTRYQWLAEFTIWAASEGLDVTARITEDGIACYFNEDVEKMQLAYMAGRLDQVAAVSLVTVSVVGSTNWYEISVVARGGG